ncbi:putative bifunctional diguanylate cyclase/phosphodiesterase [uncultured Methylobacterium sp.]|uniref:putative bifunctional diguanylate cyclase/phosphodiesterase n=1 Tax=uncultured Methylobacterium sp. TaxID=157278 RepID=UPI0035C98FD6
MPPGALRIGMTQREIIEVLFALGCYPDDITVEGLQASAQASIRAGGTLAVHRNLASGRYVSITHRPMAGGGWVATFEDVTERKEIEARIAYLARYDALTDLANRHTLRETAHGLAETVRREGRVLAVFGLSLRRFKLVNDEFGAPIGDGLLRGVADRLRAMAPGRDMVARIGSDEFGILRFVDHDAEAVAFGRALMASLQEPFAIGGKIVNVGLSLGIALWDGREPEVGLVLKSARMAMDHAKAEGAGSLRLFAPEMDERARERRALERDIDEAFGREQFELHYQPVLDIASRAIVGLEALVRWRHPTKGLISPGVFIPVVEESGLIVPLGKWVLEQACRDAVGWPEHVGIAVNVSAMQLRQGDFATTVMSALAASGLPPQRLDLEITESVLLDDGEDGLETLHRLRRAGIRISMDYFGTGYSSISYLRQFPFDKIKIDQSFVRDAPRSADALAIVRAIIGLGRSLGIRTLAEGIETEEQLAVVKAEGCCEMQGFLFSAARPAAEIDAMLGRPGGLTRAA